MGLIKEDDQVAILTDILGLEDFLGDMDFKVAGTRSGVTSIQMDIKIAGLSFEILTEALERAHKGRMHILDVMNDTISEGRSELSPHAPRISAIEINPEKIGEIIGPKGKTIRGIQDETGAKIDIDDSGVVKIAAVSGEAMTRAREMIEAIVQEPEVGPEKTEDVLKKGDITKVKLLAIDEKGRLRLSRKAALAELAGAASGSGEAEG
jgi:polyribonucleotide nucleotidyltransferase